MVGVVNKNPNKDCFNYPIWFKNLVRKREITFLKMGTGLLTGYLRTYSTDFAILDIKLKLNFRNLIFLVNLLLVGL